jgi:LysM domain
MDRELEELTGSGLHSRTTARWPVCLVTPASIMEGETESINLEGVLISCQESPPHEGTFSLLLELSDRPPFRATVKLAWTTLLHSDDGVPTLGAYLHFVSVGDADRRFLEEFLAGDRPGDVNEIGSGTEIMPAESAALEVIPGYEATQAPDSSPAGGDYETLSVKVATRLRMADVARSLGTEFEALRDLNPHIRGYYLPVGQYTVNVPRGVAFKLPAVLQQLSRSISLRGDKIPDHHYVVQPGETLKGIARKTGVSVTKLKRLNALDGNVVRAGQRLRVRSGKQY